MRKPTKRSRAKHAITKKSEPRDVPPDRQAAQRFKNFALKKRRMVGQARENAWESEKTAVVEILKEGAKLVRNKAAWLGFIKLAEWKDVKARPKAHGQKRAAKFLLRLFTGTENTKESSLIWRAVEPFALGTRPLGQLEAFLKRNGSFKAAAAANTKSKRELSEDEEAGAANDNVEEFDDLSSVESEHRHRVNVCLCFTDKEFAKISKFDRGQSIVVGGILLSKGKEMRIKVSDLCRMIWRKRSA